MHTQTKIQKWGNSLAIRLTGAAKIIPHFSENMIVDLEITETGIHIHPVKSAIRLFTEKELIASITPVLAHADELASITPQEIDV